MVQPNRVAITLSAIFAGAAGGAAVATAGSWLAWKQLPWLSFFGDPRNLYFGAVVLGIAVALFTGWTLSYGLEETWRRAAIAVTAAFGAFGAGAASFGVGMYSMMVASQFVADMLLPAYFAVCVIVWFLAYRVARRQGSGVRPAA